MLGFGRTDHTSSALAEPLVSHSIVTRCQAAAAIPEPAGSAGAVLPVSGCLLETQPLVPKTLTVPFSHGGCMGRGGSKEGERENILYLGLWCSPGQPLCPGQEALPHPGGPKSAGWTQT